MKKFWLFCLSVSLLQQALAVQDPATPSLDDDDAEFFDANEGLQVDQKKLEPWQEKMKQFPTVDEYSGYDEKLDKERAKIITQLMYCFIYTAEHKQEHSKFNSLMRDYQRVQIKRQQAKIKAEERKQQTSERSPRSFSSSQGLASPFRNSRSNSDVPSPVNSDEQGDFSDYMSHAERERLNAKDTSSKNNKHAADHTAGSASYDIRRSDRSFDW